MAVSFEAGTVIKGKFRVDRVIGEGGMGVVVAAHHVALEQRVAIKFLLPAMLGHKDIVERFAREARAASRIESDHVARVLDVDTLEDGTPFMVMEYLEGTDLSNVRKHGRPLPVDVAATFILEACEAIAEAHRLGIVHRDIKPANLFLARRADGRTRVKVLDFGISKMNNSAAEGGPSVTKTSAVMGSAEYMSPEQMLASREVDARSDIWALGVTLYEIVTARVPFTGESITQVAVLVTTEQPLLPSQHRPDLPPGFDAVVMRCLEKKRENRYGSVSEFAQALAPYAPGAATGAIIERISITGAGNLASASITNPRPVSASNPNLVPSSNPHLAPSSNPHLLPSSNPHLAAASSPNLGDSHRQYVGASGISPLSSPGEMGRAGNSTGGVTSGSSSNARSRSPLAFAILAVVVVLGVGGAWIALRGKSTSAASEPAASASAATAPVATAEPVPTASASASASASAQPEVAASATAAPAEPSAEAQAPSATATAASKPTPATHKSETHPAAAATHAAHPGKANCNPPFTVDAEGNKHAKPDCL